MLGLYLPSKEVFGSIGYGKNRCDNVVMAVSLSDHVRYFLYNYTPLINHQPWIYLPKTLLILV